MGIIELHGMEFYAYHGCYKEEQAIGNKFIVDISIGCDLTEAINTDNINDTVNYQRVYQIVECEMTKGKYKLLEHLAGKIMDALYVEFQQIKNLNLKVTKINPPLGGKIRDVSICLSRSAENAS